MPKLKKKKSIKGKKQPILSKGRRKKHVETMFLTNKKKSHPFYYKDKNFGNRVTTNKNMDYPKRGIFCIRSLDSYWLGIGPLKATMRIFKWFTKIHNIDEIAKYRLYTFPDFVLTTKPKEIRMGKGKGAPDKKVSLVKRGQIIFELKSGFEEKRYLALKLLKKIVYKMPIRNLVLKNKW